VYPALAVVQTLANNTDVLWVGSKGGMESALVQRAYIPYQSIPAAGLHGVGMKKLPRNLYLLARGLLAARRILMQFKPDVILFTGGFLAVPMAVAARKIPMMLFVPDIEPGLAIRAIAKFCDCIAVTSMESKAFFSSKVKLIETGYPTRSSLKTWTKDEAKKRFRLEENKPVLLIFGGSKGARSINNAVMNNLDQLLEFSQVIHITGELDWEEIEKKSKEFSQSISENYRFFPYLHDDMGAALAAADLVVSRSGASILGEYPMFSLPAILVPYPHAWRYQIVNAEYLVRNGAAITLEDSNLEKDMVSTINLLLKDPDRLLTMRNSMNALYRPTAATKISEQLVSMAEKRSQISG
jgi:UDP-N-acetylglucosamine--N-acetylmuramyl-(pentapeptide) pyrophosphoryl-undecaprenol N-acetylglucosamine transferase